MLAQRERIVLRGHEGSVPSVAWSPDGGRILSGSSDGTVHIIPDLRARAELIRKARERLPRELTDEEKRRYDLVSE